MLSKVISISVSSISLYPFLVVVSSAQTVSSAENAIDQNPSEGIGGLRGWKAFKNENVCH